MALVDAHRTVDTPGLGDMPVSYAEARARAWQAATPEQREVAATQLGWALYTSDADLNLGLVTTGLSRSVLSDFLTFAHQHDSDAARRLSAMWADGDLANLVRDWHNRP